jgi:aminoglycoside 3-N-acetyltransferase
MTREQLADGLQKLGLQAGSRVMVHSSLKSFGHVEGGAEAAIGALMDVLTDEGLLLMPSFNHFAPFRPNGPGYYDPRETPTTNGLIPETFRTMPGVWRSLNPTHPYAAWGTDARRYTEGHHLTLTMGPDSPLGLLGREGGYCLFLGTDYRANTYKHVVEMTTGAPCLGRRTVELPVRLPDGREGRLRTWSYRAGRCPITDPNDTVEAEMEGRGLHRRATVGESTATLYRLADFFALVAEMLREGYDGHPPCTRCPVRPGESDYDAPSDWDEATSQLKPDSPSLQIGPVAYCSRG